MLPNPMSMFTSATVSSLGVKNVSFNCMQIWSSLSWAGKIFTRIIYDQYKNITS